MKAERQRERYRVLKELWTLSENRTKLKNVNMDRGKRVD